MATAVAELAPMARPGGNPENPATPSGAGLGTLAERKRGGQSTKNQFSHSQPTDYVLKVVYVNICH